MASSSRGGGTERYADYTNSNNGQTAFTDAWQDGAKYQQLLGSGALTNENFNSQFASAKGGQDTGTVADDGGGWKLIKQDSGEKTNERKLEYKDVAAQWQAAGYDVRVQDHNPDFEGGTGEIAVRVAQAKSKPKAAPPVVLSDRAAKAIAYTKAYENVMLPRQGDYTIRNDQTVITDFNNDYKLNLSRAKAPQPQEPAVLQNADAKQNQAQVMDYANNYKKAVADTLVPNVSF